jgi:hypothetical protein
MNMEQWWNDIFAGETEEPTKYLWGNNRGLYVESHYSAHK